jgi:hypothetical protein
MSFGRFALAGILGLVVCAPLACGSLLGIDSGTPRGDASSIGDDSFSDVMTIDPPGDGGASADGGPGVDGSAGCVPNPSWCDTHCGTGPDNCNETRACSGTCPTGEQCISNVCRCQQNPTWCEGRCEKTTDNCGNPIDCGSCEAGVDCNSGFCGCVPDPVTTTCAGMQCGSADNNCKLPVNCGVNHSTDCDAGDYCRTDDTCCPPDDVTACSGRCQVSVTNNCGAPVTCPSSCPSGQECVSTSCCTPNGCVANCTDSCGQPSAACCAHDAGAPLDAGSPPPVDAGYCGIFGSPCMSASGCCSSLACGYSGFCVSSCEAKGATCSQASDCCYGLSCAPGVQTASASTADLVFPDGGVTLGETCQ